MGVLKRLIERDVADEIPSNPKRFATKFKFYSSYPIILLKIGDKFP